MNIIDRTKFEILDSNIPAYSDLVKYKTWRIGVVNYSEKISIERKPLKIERHKESDEVFILVTGEAILYIGKEQEMIMLERGKLYNVKKDTWHAITLSTRAKIFVVENSDTNSENTEYIFFEDKK